MDKVKEALLSGKVEVVDADLSSYFDLIPHRQLLRLVAKRVAAYGGLEAMNFAETKPKEWGLGKP